MGVTERRQRERDQLHTKILNAARELFAARGYEAVTMREIARQVEYSPTAIYSHFKDKEALIMALCAVDFLALADVFERVAGEPDPIKRLGKIGQAYAEFGLAHPNHYRVMFMTSYPMHEVDEQVIEKGSPDQDAYALLKITALDGIKAGCFRTDFDDAELIAQTLWAGIHGVVSLEIAMSRDPCVDWRPIKDRVSAMLNSLMQGLMKP